MKNKILALVLCILLAATLGGCGKGNKETNNTATITGGNGGDGTVLPEGGKIVFGEENPASKNTTSDGTAKPGGKDPGKPSKSTEKETGGNTSETSKPTLANDDTSAKPSAADKTGEYGGLEWNNEQQ